MNSLKTIVLLGLLTALIVAVGSVFGGRQGAMFAFLFAMVTNGVSYWFSAPIALKMSGAIPVSREQAPELYQIVEGLSEKAKIPVPTIYMIPTQSANAFATGRDPSHSSVAVTEGIMQILNHDEMEAVLAHELAHVRNRDVLITTIAAVLASVITMIAHQAQYYFMWFGGNRDEREGGGSPLMALLMIFVAPIAATLINLGISRSREFEADASGAHICGEPLALASALSKVEQASRIAPMASLNPALSSLYIIKPNPSSWFVTLFSTHPATAERIRRLEEMARSGRV
jgi:heat shock protein HtpX